MNTPITKLPGIGKKRAEQLAVLGITTVGDMVYHFPRRYEHRGDVRTLRDVANDRVMPLSPDYSDAKQTPSAFLLTVGTEPKTTMVKNRMLLTKFTAFDDSAKVTITFFNNRYVSDIFKVGLTFRFWGQLKVERGSLQLTSPEYELADGGAPLTEYVARYPLTEGLTRKFMAQTAKKALDHLNSVGIPDRLPQSIRDEYNLVSLSVALNAIHDPHTNEELLSARRRLIFDELLDFAVSVTASKKNRRAGHAPILGGASSHADVEEFYAALPFAPTNAQRRTISEIAADLANRDHRPMSRIVAGDVGSGKTVCAAAAAFIAAKSGAQTALLVPTTILARQHYADLRELMEPLGIKVRLLVGGMKAAEKRQLLSDLATGWIDIVVGTHALLSDNVTIRDLGLIITDEQHRFGVAQRAKLSTLTSSPDTPHVMVMSATPIPRTLAMTVYGDLDMSTLDELPPGRQKVDTFVVNESYRERLNGFIAKNAAEGHRTYVVCPAIEVDETDEASGGDSEKLELKNVTEWVEKLRASLPTLQIGMLHGNMKQVDKDAVMEQFADGELDVLVSTTVIEVGVNVPEATLMVVENAERFGLSQLHQLRGRVGRGSAKSWCILVSSSTSETSLARLTAMKTTSDGFKIAEYDLEQRGPGDFFSGDETTRQHGALKFRLATLYSDTEILNAAFEAVKKLPDGFKVETSDNLGATI